MRFLIIGSLFLPTALGLLTQITAGAVGIIENGSDGSTSLLAVGTFLLCLEQAHMAITDLQQIETTQKQVKDQRLEHFRWVTHSTIAIELIGFYLSVVWLGWGAFIVLLSQVWFNLLARIQLQPNTLDPIQVRTQASRLPILLADGIGLLLVSLWIAQVAPLMNAALLLSIVLLYGWMKYGQPTKFT